MATDNNSYEDDFYAWTIAQGAIIRERRFEEIDTDNVADEIESWGQHFRRKLSRTVELLQTCLLICWIDEANVFTIATLDVLRDQTQELLEDYPGLKPLLPAIIAKTWPHATKYACAQGKSARDCPATCPWGVAELLLDDWWPKRISRGAM